VQRGAAWRTVSAPCSDEVMIDMPTEPAQIPIDAV
jgi:hypothetical protein